MTTITEYIEPLLHGKDLTFEQSTQLLDIIFEGQVPEVQIAAFLTAMRAKSVTAPELAGLAKSLRCHAVAVKVDIDNLVDTCGTGGASVQTFNVSTAAALVAAGAGVRVAKHGNRGITSSSGSADVLTELGVKVDVGPEIVAKCIDQAGIGFMFAPMFHPAMKYVQPIRKSLGFRTVFNILGPLANPAAATAQVMGVADETLMPIVAEALQLLGLRYAMVVHSEGMDEISTASTTKILELKDGRISSKQLDPASLGLEPADLQKMKISDAKESAAIVKDVLTGKDSGHPGDIVTLNAAAAIIAANLADDFEPALALARSSIDDGKARAALEKLVEVSNSG